MPNSSVTVAGAGQRLADRLRALGEEPAGGVAVPAALQPAGGDHPGAYAG